MPLTEAEYNVSSVLGPLYMVTYYNYTSLISKINEVRGEGEGFTEVEAYSKDLAASWDQLASEDLTWLEELLCASTKAAFVESKYAISSEIDTLGNRVLNEQIAWNFRCALLRHASDDKVKLVHNVYVETQDAADSGGDSNVKGVKRVINGEYLEKV